MVRRRRLRELAFCLRSMLFLACLGDIGVGGDLALVIGVVVRLLTGPTSVLRSAPGGGLLLLDALLAVGRGAIALPRIRLRLGERPLLLLDLDVRMEVARTGESTWDYDRSRSYARVDSSQSGTRHRSPGPSGVAEDDRSSTFESVDFARDVSFRAVLSLIRKFHDMGEPATVPAARCKTSLASAFGLPTDSSPFVCVASFPLVVDSSVGHKLGFGQVYGGPDRARVSSCARSPNNGGFYGTSTSSFPGPYTVPPGLTSITMEKASEVRQRSVSLSASQVSSLETMLSGMCEVASWMDWWLSTCGGFRDLLPLESRADFERLMMSGSRSLEFLARPGLHGSWQSRSFETRCAAG